MPAPALSRDQPDTIVKSQYAEVKHISVAAADCLVGADQASAGRVLATHTPLSLWGGVDPATGDIIDRHHPLCGENWTGRALVMPHGRGSCTGSVVLLEAIHAGNAPALIVLSRADVIIGLGAIVAEEVLHHALPVAVLDDAAFGMALQAQHIELNAAGQLTLHGHEALQEYRPASPQPTPLQPPLQLSERDEQRLAGAAGRAVQTAMRIICRVARLQGAPRLLDVSRAHIDGCIYTGPAGLAFARQLADWQGQVAVPTTLNAISIDRQRWQRLGVASEQARPAAALADAYLQLGAQPTYTCAPYLLADPPQPGECIAWAESNAVVYANSVLGARTGKTPDLLDACIALTGRAPLAGYYLDVERRARVVVELPALAATDDALFALLGHVVGSQTDPQVPVVTGLAQGWTQAALKAFGAAFATTSSAGMFHIAGVTPAASTVAAALGDQPPATTLRLTRADLHAAWAEFNASSTRAVNLVALGNPHFALAEFAALAKLCAGRHKQAAVDVVVTTSRHVYAQAEAAGFMAAVTAFGARVLTDTCWCMLNEPIVGAATPGVVTNSAKYAHYGPGLVGQPVHLASLGDCVSAACSGLLPSAPPAWLTAADA